MSWDKMPLASLRNRGFHLKGERRLKKELARAEKGLTEEQRRRDATPHCKYPESTAKAHRNKGKARFRTGKKAQKK